MTPEDVWFSGEKKPDAGKIKFAAVNVAGVSSYTNGSGDDYEVGELSNILTAIVQIDNNSYIAKIDWANSSGNKLKIQLFQIGTGSEVSGGTDISGDTITIYAMGV